MWARPWPAGWHVPSMTTSQHPGMNELSDTFKEQWSKITWGPWLPEVCRGTRSRHMMEETRWLKENKQMWCQQLTTTRTEGSRREIRCLSNLLLHCPSASCSWGMVVKNRGRHCPRFDTFLNQTPLLFAQYLIYRPRHLPTEKNQRLETDRPPFVAGVSPPLQKVIKEIFFRVKWEQCIQKMKNEITGRTCQAVSKETNFLAWNWLTTTWSTKHIKYIKMLLKKWSEVGWVFFRFIQKPIESCGQTECLSPPTKWADGRMAERGKIKKGHAMPGVLGWCWMDLDWYGFLGNPATNTNEHVCFFLFFFKTTFFFSGGFFPAKAGLELEMDLVGTFRLGPQTPKRTTKALQQTKGFHHCKSLLSEGLMPSYGIVFFHNLHWSDLFR